MTARVHDCFQAIADPTRRAVFNLLARREMTVSDLTKRFPVSQPAVSQHLAVLRSAGLVSERKVGRYRYYRTEPTGLRPVFDWIASFQRFWREKLFEIGSRPGRNGVADANRT